MSVPKCVLIVDDHPKVRKPLRSIFDAGGFTVCGEAVDGRDAIEKAQELHPDLIVLDLSMPVMNGLVAARELTKLMPNVPLVMFTMISPSLTDTEVSVDNGHAMVEVAEIRPENDIRISEDGSTTRLLKTGLYDFDWKQNQLRVFDGKASVEDSGASVTVKGGRGLNLAEGNSLKAHKFNKKSYEEGDLYRWSSLRSAYLAEENVDAAGMYAANTWGGWGGANWYWDPWFDAYTFIPGDGIFYSPFGWGFYSPWLAYEAPFYGYGYGYGGGRYYHHFSANYRDWGSHSPYVVSRGYAHGLYRGPGSSGAGFHSGPRLTGARNFEAFGGGGFHAGGGFHTSGGFHGGGGSLGHR